MLFVFGALILFVLLFGLLLFLYLLFYKIRINRSLNGDRREKRPLPTPLQMAPILLVGLGIPLLLSAALFSSDSGSVKIEAAENRIQIAEADSLYQKPSYREMLETTGVYEKTVEERKDLRLCLYRSTAPYDSFHPSAVLYLEYMGKDADHFGYFCSFSNEDMRRGGFGEAMDGETCILLSASQAAMVDLELFFYTKDSMLRMDQESKEDPSQSYEELARRHAERIESFSFVLQES